MAVEEQVLGLEVSVNNVLGVQVLNGKRSLSSVKLGNRVRESLGSSLAFHSKPVGTRS